MTVLPPFRAALLAAAALALPATVFSQELRVRVTEPGRPNPAVGTLVSLRDGTGRVVAEGVANEFGRVRLRAPAGGYDLRIARPGFADTTRAVTVPAGLDSLTMSHAARRPVVAAVVGSSCPAGGIPGPAAGLWREIVTALRSVAVAEGGQLSLSLAAFERTLSASLKKEDEQINTILAPANRPADAGLPDTVAARGYLDQSGEWRWSAPTVLVFASDPFVGSHCFGPAAAAVGREGMVGLAFQPTAASGRVDLEGTFWLDPASRELKVIDYRFTGVPGDWRPDRFGGSLEIHRSEQGFWVTRFWYHRIPRFDPAPAGAKRKLKGYLERGAEVVGVVPVVDTTDRVAVARAIVQQEAATRSRVGKVTGTVVDTLGYPVGDAEVALLGTETQTTANRDGKFVLDGLPLGLQILRVRKVGYKVQYFSVRLAGGQEWEGRVAITRLPQILGEIVVVGKYGKPPQYAKTSKYDDFYRRRAARVGKFMTREEIDARAAGKISELLRAMPGVRIGFTAPGVSEEIAFVGCPASNVSVWIDGQKMTGEVGEVLPLITPSDIETLEVYQRQALIPPEFRDNSCGAIVLWSRMGGK